MIIDEKGRLFGKVSIIDLLVVAVLAFALVGICYRYTKSNTAVPFVKTDKIEVKFFVEEAADFQADAVKIGDPVKESVQNASLGRVVDIKRDKPIRWVETADGRSVKTSREGHFSLIITIEADGVFGKNGVAINNIEYFIGRTMVLYVGNTALHGRIFDLKKIG